MDSDSSVSPLLSLACRFLPHDQWFTTHVDPDWKVKQVKSWLLAKCLPYAAPPSPPLRQSARKPLRPPSPITFAPDPRHRPISPITFAMPKAKATPDDASEFEETPADDELSESESQTQPEEILPPVLPKKRAILPTASTAPKGDLYSQFTLIRFSTGQLLEDDLPLSFYDMQEDELLELHRVGVVVTLPRAHPTRYLDAYWEGWVRVLRIRPIDAEEDSYQLYKIRQLETRALEWRDRWLVVREGNIHLCQNEERPIHTLALSHLLQLTNSGLPPAATPSSKTRVLLARFGPGQQKPSSLGSTRASSPIGMGRFDYSDSDSNLSSPVFAHDSSDSNRPRRKLQKRARKRPDPEFLAMDLKDDAAYVSLLRVLHRHTLPRSTFVDKLPVGTADLLPHSYPHSSPFAHHPPPDDDADDPTPPALRHPPSLAHLRAPPRGLSLGALPYPEWRTGLLLRARRAGLGRIGRALEWKLWHGDGAAEEGEWMLQGQSPVRSRRGKGKGAQRERARGRRPVKPTSTDGYDSDDEEPDPDDGGAASDGSSSSSGSGRGGGGARSETEWEGWMGDLRRQRRVAADEHIRVSMLLEAQRRAEESRDAELGLPPLLPGANASSSVAEVTVSRVGTGVDDRQRRAALEPSAVVTSLSGVNPPTHPSYHYQLHSQSHHGHGASPSAGSSTSGGAHMMTPVLSSPSSNESLGFAFSPLAELGDEDVQARVAYAAHTRTHSHTLLHSVSMHDVHPHGYAHGYAHPLHMNFPASHGGAGPLAYDAAAFARRPSMPVIGSAARWGEGSRPSTAEHDAGGSSTGVTEVPRAGASASLGRSGSVGGKGLLRKRDGQREREREQQSDASDWRKGKERERERSPIPTFTARRPRLSVSTTDPPRPSRGQQQQQPQQALSPPATPLTEHAHPPAPDTLNPLAPAKKKRRNLARGVSIRAEKFVKSLDSALDFVDGR